jgi:ATP-binding cassette subfamily B protein
MDDMLKPRTEWQRLFAFVRPTWKQWAGLTISLLLSAGLGAVPPLLVRDIIDRALPNSDHRLLLLLAAAMILASVGAGMIGLWRDALVKEIGEQKMLDLRGRLFERSLYRSLHFFTSSDAGEVLSRLQNDVAGVRTVVNGLVVTIAFNFIQIITILSMLLYMNAGLAVIAIVALPLFIVPARRVGTKTQELTHETHIEMSRLTGLAQEMLSVSGWLLLRLFGAQRYASKSFHARSQRLCDLSV